MPRFRKHGLATTPEYRAWQQMVRRCTVPTHPAWNNYGGRGITVCDRWLNSVEAFVMDMGSRPSPKHEIDRIDNAKGYEPGNCRWVTRAENDRNRRNNRLVTFRGETLTVAEWVERTGIPGDTLSAPAAAAPREAGDRHRPRRCAATRSGPEGRDAVILVTVELVSARGPDRDKVIGTLQIGNVGGSDSVGDYQALFDGEAGAQQVLVLGFPRLREDAWELVRRALEQRKQER